MTENNIFYALSIDWLIISLLFFIGLITWTYNKHIGYQALYLTFLSLSVAYILAIYFPLVNFTGEQAPLTFIEIQTLATFMTFFIPLTRNRIRLYFFIIAIIGFSVLLTAPSIIIIFSIISSLIIGSFITFTFYRSLDWIEAMPEQYLIIFFLILPVGLCAIIYPHESYMLPAGIMIGSGIGAALELLKVRMSINPSMNRKIYSALIGLSGTCLFYLIALFINPFVNFSNLIIGVLLGLWITLLAPYYFTYFKIYSSEGVKKQFS